ncbi:acyltransferase family protein [Paenibacillus sp. Soil724D2]|uniref:acyltransferase family protein n=1 Tax=Paenibacillus sp. (strain Soil724D2) TaxID=1736392 RepID=UPI0007155149|nr:acyltransferase [Paenibacillus sp. Soil724D2]KRE51054.1 hypothetical protein ASG85_19040 [Paenibacillus sp. Soil724D2]
MIEIKRLSALDSLRGIAAIGVAFFWHYQHFKPEGGYPFSHIGYWFYHFGWNLVDFFFVLSGFIFTYVYKQKISERKLLFQEFSVLRLSRLYPLHIVTLLVVAIIQFIRYISIHNFYIYQYNDVYHLILNLLFIQHGWFELGFSFNAPTWSISSEVVAYILFFFIIYYSKYYKLFFIAMIFLGLTIYHAKLNSPFFNEGIARVLIGFFIGCLTCDFNNYLGELIKKYLVLIGIGVIIILSVIASIFYGHKVLGDWALVYTIMYYPIIIILLLNIGLLRGILSLKPFAYIGEVSYSIYLWHFPLQLMVNTLDNILELHINYSSKKVFIGFVLLTLIVSIISFEFFEKPFSKFLRRRFIPTKT